MTATLENHERWELDPAFVATIAAPTAANGHVGCPPPESGGYEAGRSPTGWRLRDKTRPPKTATGRRFSGPLTSHTSGPARTGVPPARASGREFGVGVVGRARGAGDARFIARRFLQTGLVFQTRNGEGRRVRRSAPATTPKAEKGAIDAKGPRSSVAMTIAHATWKTSRTRPRLAARGGAPDSRHRTISCLRRVSLNGRSCATWGLKHWTWTNIGPAVIPVFAKKKTSR